MDAQVGLLTTAQYLYVYGGVILAIIIISHIRIYNFVVMTMRASENLHNIIYEKLIVAVMRFFDTNPSGEYLILQFSFYLVCQPTVLTYLPIIIKKNKIREKFEVP